MARITTYQIPPLVLVVLGIYIGLGELLAYITYIADPPSHRLGMLAEMVLLGFLLFAGALVAIGVRGFRNRDAVLSLSVLVGLVALRGTFAIELYSQGMKTERTLVYGAALSVVPAVATYLCLTHTEYLTVRSST